MPEKEKIREMFDSIAQEYDAFNHLTSLGIDRIWRRRALRYIDGPQVLDIACGTGDFAITIAERKHCGVVGVDISEGMLAQMRKKVVAGCIAPLRAGSPSFVAEIVRVYALRTRS